MSDKLSRGVIVGASKHVEWLLPWWWYHYSSHNTLPVAFFDFGLSKFAREWCKERGCLVSLNSTLSIQNPTKKTASLWERTLGPGLWAVRSEWFKKPLACLSSPFAKTLWLDLDCEIRANLEPLLSHCPPFFQIAEESPACQEWFQKEGITLPGEKTYNSGVLSFSQNHELLFLWKEEISMRSQEHMGDQNALSRVLWTHPNHHTLLSNQYNWDPDRGPNKEALILHWSSTSGKKHIHEQISVLAPLGLFSL